jgi:hypothetical protein
MSEYTLVEFAERGRVAIEAHHSRIAEQGGNPAACCLQDVIADILHYADATRLGMSGEDVARWALDHYRAERDNG